MKKPYIICHMMTSVDGRIDCAMTSKFKPVYPIITPRWLRLMCRLRYRRVTAELEMAEPGKFAVSNTEIYGQEGFSKKADCAGYEVIVDTKGTLIWPDAADMEKPYLLLCF